MGFEFVFFRFYLLFVIICILNCDCFVINVLFCSLIFLCVMRLICCYGDKLLEDKIVMWWSFFKFLKLVLCKVFIDNWMNVFVLVFLIFVIKEKMFDGEEYFWYVRFGCNVLVIFWVFVLLIMINIWSIRIVRIYNLVGICCYIIIINWEVEKYINDIVRSIWFKFF